MKALLFAVVLFIASCSDKYDGEIVVTSKGEVVKIVYQGTGNLYFVEPLDTAQVKRAAEIIRSASKQQTTVAAQNAVKQ